MNGSEFSTKRDAASAVLLAASAILAQTIGSAKVPVVRHMAQVLLAASEGRWRAAAESLELAARADRESE